MVIICIVDISLVLKLRLIFKMVMFSVIERWEFLLPAQVHVV